MSLIRKNIIANLIGSGWVALISIAFIPLYIHFMGVESYGLVGFYLTLQALFAVLDMGLTATVSRELARLSVTQGKAREMRNLVRTLEIIYWGVAVLIAAVVTLLAPWIATNWLNADMLSQETIQQAIMLMGIIIALRMPYGFYSGGLLGLQRQVLLNVIKVVVETLRSGGAVLVLWLVSPDITAFFLWQALIAAIGTVLMFAVLQRCMPESPKRAGFEASIFHGLWRFAAGMSVITVLSTILVQMDKLVLSFMLPLEAFAYYSLASTVAIGLYVIIAPLFSAIYPRFTQLVENNAEQALKELYHKSCQLMTVLVFPLALALCFFSLQILQIWTQNEELALHAAPVLSLLMIGTALNGMMNLPFALQLAHGWTRLAMTMNMVAILVLLPTLLLAVHYYGVIGAASIWMLLNAGYVLFGLALMHRKILKGELKRWLVTDFTLPALASLLIIACFWLAFPQDMAEVARVLWIVAAVLTAWIAAAFAAPAIRCDLLNILCRRSIGEGHV